MSTSVTPTYRALTGWEQLPQAYSRPDVAAVAVDSKSRVYLFCRAEHPVMVYEPGGRFIGSWGEGLFSMRTHGITVGPGGSVYRVDGAGPRVRPVPPDGKLVMTVGGNDGKASR